MKINNMICTDGVKCPYCDHWIEGLEKVFENNMECPNCHKHLVIIETKEYQAYRYEDQTNMMENVFCKNLRILRAMMGFTQKEFAELLDIPQPSVSAYENNRNSPTMEVLINIAQKCNVSIDWLCGLSSIRTPR